MLSTPIAFMVFNRPRHTRETFASIRAQQPSQLFIIADGPRQGNPTDVERCHEVRGMLEDHNIDWPCTVFRNYSEQNLGCKDRCLTGIDWVFEQVDEAIILEDDILPHPDFYGYCEALLNRYRNDRRVMAISGDSFVTELHREDASYYFSKFCHVWGWATWRRAWQKNNPSLSFWPEWKESESWTQRFPDMAEQNYWGSIFDQMSQDKIDTWDYPWTASIWYYSDLEGGLTATSNINLVTNIGIGPDATHTLAETDTPDMPTYPLGELVHPDRVEQDVEADRYVWEHLYMS